MISPTMIVIGALSLLLALSAAGNAWLLHSRDKALSAEARAEQLERDTRAAAESCSASVEDLARKGDARQKALMGQMAAIAPTVAAYQVESIAGLRARPDNAQDLCGSLLRYWQAEIQKGRSSK